eukprot:11316581-Ditylum_brightwellii.AAC.1
MFSPALLPDFKETTISDHFCLKDHRIKSVKRTQLTEEKGKWFILYKAKDARRAQNFVDCVLPRLFTEYVRKEQLVPGYKVSNRRLGNSR